MRFNLAKRFKRAGSVWTWEFTNFEPSMGDDLRIAVHPATEFHLQQMPVEKEDDGKQEYATFVKIGDRWEMRHRFYSVKASSTHAPEGDNDYGAQNVREYHHSAWVEGADGDGVGESLTLTL